MSTHPPQANVSVTDEQLVTLYRGGQTDAFGKLMIRYREELFHFLLRFTSDRAAAEDLFQETFLQVHLSAESFDVERRFKPWLFTIAANKARDFLRRNSRKPMSALSAPVGGDGEDTREFLDLLEADLQFPGENLERQETRELVKQVMAEMPDHLREVLILAYFNQFPYKQIADMLKVPLGTVKSRLHAAVAAFAQIWKRRYVDHRPETPGTPGSPGSPGMKA